MPSRKFQYRVIYFIPEYTHVDLLISLHTELLIIHALPRVTFHPVSSKKMSFNHYLLFPVLQPPTSDLSSSQALSSKHFLRWHFVFSSNKLLTFIKLGTACFSLCEQNLSKKKSIIQLCLLCEKGRNNELRSYF